MLLTGSVASCGRSKPPVNYPRARIDCLPIETTPLPTVDPDGWIAAGEPGCEVDPDRVAACVTPAAAIQLHELLDSLTAFRADALALCSKGVADAK